MITVYGRPSSLNVQVVMWTLAELDLPVTRIDAGFGFGGTDTPEFRAMNPNGLVPVMTDDSVTLFESAAIMRYLAGRYGRFPFWPEDPVARAPVDMWAEWGKSTLQASFMRYVFQPVLSGGTVDEKGLALFGRQLDILDAKLGTGPWILGEAFTAADIEVGALLYRYFTLPIDRSERPAVTAYYARLTARPTFATHVMVEYGHLRALMR